jgi:hypothetical protein
MNYDVDPDSVAFEGGMRIIGGSVQFSDPRLKFLNPLYCPTPQHLGDYVEDDTPVDGIYHVGHSVDWKKFEHYPSELPIPISILILIRFIRSGKVRLGR